MFREIFGKYPSPTSEENINSAPDESPSPDLRSFVCASVFKVFPATFLTNLITFQVQLIQRVLLNCIVRNVKFWFLV